MCKYVDRGEQKSTFYVVILLVTQKQLTLTIRSAKIYLRVILCSVCLYNMRSNLLKCNSVND